MQPHQQRVVAERDELQEKISRLSAFINSERFESVELSERMLLLRQWSIMLSYASVLNERIGIFMKQASTSSAQ